ncbi:MAG: SGNH/GDSL hydrolase family protein [Planctomycetota bacterium]
MSPRPRGSRFGLFLFLAILALATLEAVGRLGPAGLVMPPSKFLAASWAVATGGELPVSSAEKPTDEALAKNAYRPLAYVMYGLKPSWSRDKSKDGLDRTTNALGFRGPEVQQPKPAGRYRIICLGGSTTYDDGVGDADTYPAQLQEMLRDALPSRDIEVINAGVPSYTSAESLTNLVFRCLELSPDALLIFDNINDFRPRTYSNFSADYFHYRKTWDGTANTWMPGEDDLAGGINPFIQFLPPKPNGKQEDNVRRAGTWAFRRNLTCMAVIAQAHGVKPWFMSFVLDRKHKFSTPHMVAAADEQNDVLRDVAEAQGAGFIDLAAVYPEGDFFTDPVHNNAAGAKLKARLIADVLLKDPAVRGGQ